MGHAPQDRAGLALRARIVLASAEGRSNTAVAALLGISRVTVIKWRARDLEETLGIYRDLGNRRGPGNALIFLRIARRATRDYPAAAGDLEETLGIYRDLGDRGGEAEALNEAGTLHRVAGDLRQAGACHQQALDLTRQIGSSWDEAHALASRADAPRLSAAPPRHKTSCGRRWRSSSGSGRPRPPRFPAN